MNTRSSTNTTEISPSSTKMPTQEEAYLKLLKDTVKPETPAQIRARGDIKIRIGVLIFVGIICSILSIIGGISFITSPENAKDVWVIIGPIISGAVTGTIGFLTGEKSSAKN